MRACVMPNTAAEGVTSMGVEGGCFGEERQKDNAVGMGVLAWWHARPGFALTQSCALPCQCLFCLGKRLILAT